MRGSGKGILKKFLKTLIITIGVMIAVFGSLAYLISNGFPWKQSEIKKVANKYLKNQYKQEMIIDGSGYDFKGGHYYATAHTKEAPSISLFVFDENGEITDTYRYELWKSQITADIKPYLNKLYPNMVNFDASAYPKGELHFAPKSEIPNYKSLASESEITIWFNNAADYNMENEYQKAFELLKYTREHLEQNKLNQLTIYYEEQGKSKNIIDLSENDLESVHSWQDIESIVNRCPICLNIGSYN
jgi:hypothetical protein